MKQILTTSLSILILLNSCGSDPGLEDNPNLENEASELVLDNSKFEELAIDPCNFISEEMVTSRFTIRPEDELEQETYGGGKKISWTAYCQYVWKKPDFESINQRNAEIMMAAMKSGDVSNAMQTAMDVEPTHFTVGVTNLKLFSDEETALKRFEQSNTVPSKEDMAHLNKEVDKALGEKVDKEVISEQGKEVGEELVDGIAQNLKFEKIDGIGTLAYWDFMSDQLNVLFGTVQVGIKMHISENHEENVAAAKEFAAAVRKLF